MCVKTVLKLDDTIVGLPSCSIQASRRAGPVHRPVVRKWLKNITNFKLTNLKKNANFNTAQIPTFSFCISIFSFLNPSFSNFFKYVCWTTRVLHGNFRRILLFIGFIVVDTFVPGLADRNFPCSLS